MTVWLIILGILLLLVIPFLIPIRFRLVENEEMGAVITLYYGFLRIPVYPTPPRKIKRRHYTRRAIEKRRKKERDKQKRNEAKKAEKAKQKGKKEKFRVRSALSLARFALRTIALFLRKFGSHLHIVIRELQLIIASEDASQTALLYGAVTPIADAILQLTQAKLSQVRIARNAPISCCADFLSEKSRIRICIDFSIRPYHLLGCVFLVLRRAISDNHIRRLLLKHSL